MNSSHDKIKFTVLCSVDIFMLIIFRMLFKMTTSVESNKSLLFVVAIPFAVLFIFTAVNIFKRYVNDNLIIPNIPTLVITLVLTVCLCEYLTTFSFERWQDKELLRPFMAAEFIDIQNNRQKHRNNEYRLKKYTDEERKELLITNEYRNKSPEVTVNFSDKELSSEIYYAYNGVDFKDYWLVLILRNGTVERAEIYPSGTTVDW